MFKRIQFITLAALAAVLPYGTCSAEAAQTSAQGEDMSNKQENIDMIKLSEAFGHFIGRHLQSPGMKFDLESLIRGIREGAAGAPAPMSEKEYEEMMAAVQEKAFKEMSSTNLQNANDFMEKNSKVSGVVEIVPGKLQYILVHEGSGATVQPHSSPMIQYTGKYLDGNVFGTSEETGAITIPLDQTIPGFSKGIVGMKEGEKRKLYVHPDLGYGTSGQLPPNELLVFDIELIKADTAGEQKKDAPSDGKDSFGDDEDYFDFEEDELIDVEPKSN